MKIYYREWEQLVSGSMPDVWHFFSRPENLQKITPPDMDFKIRTDLPGVKMYPGMLIQYKVAPFPGFKTDWVTEITAVVDQQYFIDEQRFGPFRFWHHQHHFEVVEHGILMRDVLHYALPFGWLGQLVNQVLVGPRIERIFSFRESVISNFFPAMEAVNL